MSYLNLILLSVCLASGPVYSSGPFFGPTNPSPETIEKNNIRYFGSAVELKPEYEDEYRKLHADVWEDVVHAIKGSNIHNYHIFLVPIGDKKYLFSFFEYHGDDWVKDASIMSSDNTTREKWWPITDSYQEIIPGTPEGEQWLPLESLMFIK